MAILPRELELVSSSADVVQLVFQLIPKVFIRNSGEDPCVGLMVRWLQTFVNVVLIILIISNKH